jgi:hypothetical protein
MIPQIPAQLRQLVSPAKPSHAAELCTGFVVWHIVWHRGTGDTVHRYETCAHARDYHEICESHKSRHNCSQSTKQRYWHITNNAIGILQTAVLAYHKQRYWHMGNNGSVIWAITVSAYHKQRYWHMRLQAYNDIGLCVYAHMRLKAYCKCLSIAIGLCTHKAIIRTQPCLIRTQPFPKYRTSLV